MISLYLYSLNYCLNNKIIQFAKYTIAIILALTIILGLPAKASGEKHELKFEQLINKQGLSQSAIICILEDSKGFMWFGTEYGLNKYDGYKFTYYIYDFLDSRSLSDNFINSIYEDKDGIIWVGTENGGLNKFERKTATFTHYKHDPNNIRSISANRILAIYEDDVGILWIGTDGGGLNKFNKQTEQFTWYIHQPKNSDSLNNNTVLSIYEDDAGILWIGTDGGGLNKFNRLTGKFTHYQHNPDDFSSLSDNTVLSIYEDSHGRLWIGTLNGGLNQFDRETGQFIHYQHDPIKPNSLINNTVGSITEDKGGNLWLATSSWYGESYGKKLDKFNPETEQFTHYSNDPSNPTTLNDTVFVSLLIDSSEILWIGTGFGGVNKLDQKDTKFIHYKYEPNNLNSISDNHILSIYEDYSGLIWIGTDSSGLNKFDRQTGKFTHYTHDPNNSNSLSSDNVWSIYEDSNGALWVGAFGGGLNKLDRQTGKFTHYTYDPNNPNSLNNNTVSSIYEDRKGTLWIGTFGGGLDQFNRQTEEFSHYLHNPDDPNSLSDNSVVSIYEDSSGTLWITTFNGGLNKFDRETEKFTRYTHETNNPNSLSYDRVLSINEYPAGTLWLGTYGGGLNKFDIATETFTHYTENDGLPSNSVVGILADDNENLWLSTGNGLSKFNPEAETFRNYDVGDGLQGNEFDGVKAYAKTKDGAMLFGGLNGFNLFYPDQVKDNPHIPPIVITDFRIFDQTVKLNPAISVAKDIKLSYKDNFFSFEFAALDYTNPKKNQYAYKLEGFDQDWIYSGTRRYASYTNLDPGTYTFRVKGSNNDGVWNEEGTSVAITITPPPWKTGWAYTLYGIAVFGAIYGYVQWKTLAQARENALLRASEKKLNQILEALPIGVAVINQLFENIYVNKLGWQFLGKELAPKATGKNYSEIYQFYIAGTDKLYPSEKLPIVRALQGETARVDDFEVRNNDKRNLWEILATPIYDEKGNIIYSIAAFQDITHRKQLEAERQQFIEALQQTNEQLQVILNTVPGCVAWISADGRYLGVNQHAVDNWGLSPSDFIGQKIGFRNKSSEYIHFIHQFLASSELTASQVVDFKIKDSIRNYLIIAQKYQQGKAAVLVGIDITEQKQAEAELQTSLREKIVLLQEVHHRVKNNLQIISSLLDLQSQRLTDPQVLDVFQQSENRVKSMALVHNQLYQSTSLEKIDFADYVETLASYLFQSYGVNRSLINLIKLQIDVEPISLNLDTAIPCGLLLNELLSNALKYAFPESRPGVITIKLTSECDRRLTLTVQDNGIGLPEGFEPENPKTLGFQLIQALSEQLEGELDITQDQGTQFTIRFFDL
ncbi:two-component regulator propeller domain-containing protein [Coleofasciculus sp. F4-SAH-05]|uniref:two-component regulator propeller domain-containing protein n=1 Tax=Coleofasciculus sp. F4-SAH-05 TaxID=3069525 RepID=UPI0032FDDF82